MTMDTRAYPCRACGAPIVFVKSAQGKYIPCDAKLVRYRANPTGKGIVVVEGEGAVRCDLDFEGLPTGMARISHFATCPQAGTFRKR